MSRPVDNLGITRCLNLWMRGWGQLGPDVDTFLLALVRPRVPPSYTTELSPVCPQGRTSDELLKQGLSTQSTASYYYD